MFRHFAIITVVALGLSAGLTTSVQAQPKFKNFGPKKIVVNKKNGFGINVNFGNKGIGGFVGKKSYYPPQYCPPNYCPPKYQPPAHCSYVVQYCMPHWRYKTFHCYDEAYQFRCYKRSRGYEVYIQNYGGCYRVYYRLCTWRTYRTCNNYGYAQQLQHQLQGQGFQTKVFQK